MICYKDQTFCCHVVCENAKCHRRIAPDDITEAHNLQLPISYADFRDFQECKNAGGFVLPNFLKQEKDEDDTSGK